MSIAGKTALVTGAATGIGAAIAKRLADSGAQVIGADISWNSAAKTPGLEQVQYDLSDPESVKECFADIGARHGGVDILVNNAALASTLTPKPFDKITPEEWTRVMTVNTIMPLLCSQAAVPHMREQQWGRIVNLTSATIFLGTPYNLHYISSKGAIAAMTRALAKEIGGDKITVNAIAPGMTVTENIEHNSAYTDKLLAGTVAARAIQREERAEDLAGTCLFLVGDDASFITGQIVTVDGGTAFH